MTQTTTAMTVHFWDSQLLDDQRHRLEVVSVNTIQCKHTLQPQTHWSMQWHNSSGGHESTSLACAMLRI
eukprot:scaffold46647_cov25-Prasinocladus_malaysianus.AAC.2